MKFRLLYMGLMYQATVWTKRLHKSNLVNRNTIKNKIISPIVMIDILTITTIDMVINRQYWVRK